VKLDMPRGVLVINVISKSAADKAGIKEGDVILSVNGQEVNQPNELQARVAIQNPGEKVDLEVWRYGKKMQISATLQGRDGESSVAEAKKEEKKESIRNVGLSIQNLTAEQARELELKTGILVINVDRGSVASKAGLSRGDVIFEINNEEIKSVDDFYSRIGQMDTGEVVSLKVRRKQNNDLFDRLIFMEIPAN
jgi:serine protease Do